MMDIVLLRDKSRNCYEDCIVSVCKWLDCNYILMFCRSWRSVFIPEESHKGNDVDIRLDLNINEKYELLKKYYGLEVNFHNLDSLNNFCDVFNKELEFNRPILLEIDSFWCPWDDNYQHLHTKHATLIVGIDYNNKYIFCIDPFYSKGR